MTVNHLVPGSTPGSGAKGIIVRLNNISELADARRKYRFNNGEEV